MKHTKGPWLWKQSRGNNIYEHKVYSQKKIFETVANLDGEIRERTIANAKLIAAAPDLLEALNGLIEIMDCECDNTHEQNKTVCRVCWAKQAIQKATE